jgi:PAS domain S-box-containing protein
VLWLAIRFPSSGAAGGVIIVALAGGFGFLVTESRLLNADLADNPPLYPIQVYAMLVSLIGVSLSLVMTSQRKALISLGETYAQLVDAQRIGRMGNWSLDPATGRLTWSDEIYRIFGVDAKGFGHTYEAFAALVHPADRERLDIAQRKALSGAAPLDIIHRILVADGGVRWVHERAELAAEGPERAIRLSGTAQDVTLEQVAQQEMLAARERFEALTELTSDWYWEQDKDFRFTEITGHGVTRSIFGREESLGKTRWELPFRNMTKQDWVFHRALLEEHREFRDLVLEAPGEAGGARFISVSGRPKYDESGTFAGYVGVGKDVTDRMLAERRLAESEARFRALADLSADWYWEQDENLCYVEIGGNFPKPAVRREFLGKTRWALPLNQATDAEWAAHRADLEARRTFRDFVYRRMAWDGSHIGYIRVSGHPIFDDNGRFRGYRGIGRDITQEKLAEQAARKAETRFRVVIESAEEGVALLDAGQRIRFANQKLADLLGCSRDEIVGSEIWSLVDNPAAREALRRSEAGASGTRRRREVVLKRRNGESVDALLALSPIEDEDAGTVDTVVMITDISELKIAQQNLERAIDGMKDANEQLQQFAFVASHDLQEPLRKIIAFGGRIRDRLNEEPGNALDETSLDFLVRMLDAADRQRLLVEALLEYSRVNTRGGSPGRIELSAVVDEVLDDLQAAVAEAGARIQVGSLPAVHADAIQLRQVVQNLVSNAIKFHNPGAAPEITIEGGTRTGGSGSRVAWFSVSDKGLGIDAEFAERVFLPFERLHGRGAYPGSGMGLAIVKRVVERHGGTVSLQSVPGQGSRFEVELPPG